MDLTPDLEQRIIALITRLESTLPAIPTPPDWSCIAFRWRSGQGLESINNPHRVSLSDLLCIDISKAEIIRNTRQFVEGRGANNALLWGSRGTGKSSLIKALLSEFSNQGLRLIEVEKQDLRNLPEIIRAIEGRPERFILYCDDLSFEEDDTTYKALKAALDGSISAPPENLLIYATSNRRHLLPEYKKENLDVHIVEGEIHQNEGVDEKISLSERFGLWLSFYPFTQDQYLMLVKHWLDKFDTPSEGETLRLEALRWAHQRGSRSGRVAYQFAKDQAGRTNDQVS